MLKKINNNLITSQEEIIQKGLEVYSLCKAENYEPGMAAALLNIGYAYLCMSKYEKAMQYLFQVIDLSQKHSICDMQIFAYIDIGNIYFDIGEYEKSLDYYNYAEKLTKIFSQSKIFYKEYNVEIYTAIIYNNIGEICRILECYEDAVIYYNMANELEKNFNYEATFGMVLTNLGNVEYCLGNYEKSLEYLNRAVSVLYQHNYKIGLVEVYGILALVYEKKENYEECKEYFSKAIKLSNETDYSFDKIDLVINYSKFLGRLGKINLAIEKLEEVYNISLEKGMYTKTMEICKRIIELYEEADDISNANRYYKLYFENEKRLEHIEAENKVGSLKTKIQLDDLEKENESILEKSESFRKRVEELTEVIKSMSIISELGEKITTTLDIDQIYEMLYATTTIFIQVSGFAVGLYNSHNGKIEFPYAVENDEKIKMIEVSINNKSSMAAKCLKDKKIIVINDMHNEYLNYLEDVNYIIDNKKCEGHNSVIYCPLIISNNFIGVMTVQSCEKDSFTLLAVEMIKALSSYAAIAINNAIKSKSLLAEARQRREIQIELENTNKKLIYLSENDGLTNIPNRRKFDCIINEEWIKAKANKATISLILFDIDYFKQYNDNYGHTRGDECLISVSRELHKLLTKNYFAARYGGDEFAVILPDTDLVEAVKFGENFRLNVERLSLQHMLSLTSNVITVTLGICSVIPTDDITIIDLIRQADTALYEAKNIGRNRVAAARL